MIDTDRFVDVLEALLAPIGEVDVQLAFDFLINLGGEADAPRSGDRFKAGRDVHPIAVKVLPLDHDVAKIDADAELHRQWCRRMRITVSQELLDLAGAPHRFNGARELGKHRIAGRSEYPAAVFGDHAVDDRSADL